jgi:hypothetical protein
MDGYIYIIQNNIQREEICKIGMSKTMTLNRVKQYGKDVIVHMIMTVNNVSFVERMIIKNLKEKYKQIRNEYFEYGELNEFRKDVIEMINKYNIEEKAKNVKEEMIKKEEKRWTTKEMYEEYIKKTKDIKIKRKKNTLYNIETNEKINQKELYEEMVRKNVIFIDELNNIKKVKELYEYFKMRVEEEIEEVKEENKFKEYLEKKSKYKEGEIIYLNTIKKEYSKWLGKSVSKLDNGTFGQVNSNYIIIQIKVCKNCKNKHKKGCCESYQREKRTTLYAVNNIELISTDYYKKTSFKLN